MKSDKKPSGIRTPETDPIVLPVPVPKSDTGTDMTMNVDTHSDELRPRAGKGPQSDRFEATLVGVSKESGPALRESYSGGTRYEIVRLIGRGGMGQVFLARDRQLNDRFVAVKRLSPEAAEISSLHQRFLAEAKAMTELSSAHTIRILDCGDDQEGPFIAMEFVSGPHRTVPGWPADLPSPPLTLQEYIENSGPMPIPDALTMIRMLCSALGEAHGKRYIHRDIKPGNILLTAGLEPKLIDFGLARNVRPEESQHTAAGDRMLTIGYGAPEQEADARAAVEQSDIYSLAAVLWFITTGKNPRIYRPEDAPVVLRSVFATALAARVEDRPANVRAFEEILKLIVAAPTRANQDRKDSAVSQLISLASLLDAERVSGTCPVCQHRHDPIPASPKVRQFCAGCGTSLWLKCQKCESKAGLLKLKGSRMIPVWDRFCSRCGHDLIVPIVESLKKIAEFIANANLASKENSTKCRELAMAATASLTELSTNAGTDLTLGTFGNICTAAMKESSRLRNLAVNTSVFVEEQLWQDVQKACSIGSLDDYLTKYPNGKYVQFANQEREYILLRDEIDRRIKVKDLAGLSLEVVRLINLSSRALKEWTDERLSRLLARDPMPEACLMYLQQYHDGKFSAKARGIVSPWLRSQLTQNHLRRDTRTTYLRYRQEEEKDDDVSRAYMCTILTWVPTGAFASIVLFRALEPPLPFLFAMLAGSFVVALASGWLNDSGRRFGPLPALFYLIPHGLMPPTHRPFSKEVSAQRQESESPTIPVASAGGTIEDE